MVRGFFSRLDHGRKVYRERKRLGLCVLNGCNRPLAERRVKCQFHLDESKACTRNYRRKHEHF